MSRDSCRVQKEKATRKTKEWASEAGTSAIIHRKDGKVQTSHRYS
ncbi:DUF2188 domain-containing protein [Paenibacillus filicis]|uniref:DUF2188 domain-containing protein n=1 Tax=Paenibacillus gyeongsangnamensis TaxID=3388067 RepID=A0ABT4Q2Z9_9BACL|nr:DUF2188 domain-containing protein [Paenibacillus filicis]MCZ8511256.1 DUF2188 domain-containing protein [Paenibacillus filicis]